MPEQESESIEFNVHPGLFYPGPTRQPTGIPSLLPMGTLPPKHAGGRRPGHAVSKCAMIRDLNAGIRSRIEQHDTGPVYLWWGARVLGVSVPTLRNMLRDYHLNWPPPWPPAE